MSARAAAPRASSPVGARPRGESTSAASPGGRRSFFVRPRRFFASSRRSREAAVGRGGYTPALTFERLAQLPDEPLDRELAVSPLAALVLGDRSQDGPRLGQHSSLLHVRQRGRLRHVEERLDPGLGRVGVLAPRAARAGEAELDLGEGQHDRPRHPNRLRVHGRHSARRRRRPPCLGRPDPGRGRGGRSPPDRRPPASLRHEQLDALAGRARRGAARDGLRARGRRAADDTGGRRGASSAAGASMRS